MEMTRKVFLRIALGAVVALCLSLLVVRVTGGSAPAQQPIQGVGDAPPAGTRVILITGSTDGLGREVALRLAATGAHIIVHGRNRERGMAVVAEIRKGGKGTARFYAADLASFAQVRSFANSVLKDYTRLDVLVNNAGIWLRDATV